MQTVKQSTGKGWRQAARCTLTKASAAIEAILTKGDCCLRVFVIMLSVLFLSMPSCFARDIELADLIQRIAVLYTEQSQPKADKLPQLFDAQWTRDAFGEKMLYRAKYTDILVDGRRITDDWGQVHWWTVTGFGKVGNEALNYIGIFLPGMAPGYYNAFDWVGYLTYHQIRHEVIKAGVKEDKVFRNPYAATKLYFPGSKPIYVVCKGEFTNTSPSQVGDRLWFAVYSEFDVAAWNP